MGRVYGARPASGIPYTPAMPPIPFASRLLFAAAWCVGRLPLRVHQRIGDALGAFTLRRNAREARVARRNLELVPLAPAGVEVRLPDNALGPDDVVIRIRRADDETVVDVRSKSRVGMSDLGTNARRIRTFRDEMLERL